MRALKQLLALLPLFALVACPVQAQEAKGFAPCAAFTFSVTNTTANQQLSNCGANITLINTTTTEVFYSIGTTNAVTATASSLP